MYEIFFMDFVVGKGKGLIIFLYGVFGVGKIFIVECVVVELGRLFLFIICGDIGIIVKEVERILEFFCGLV